MAHYILQGFGRRFSWFQFERTWLKAFRGACTQCSFPPGVCLPFCTVSHLAAVCHTLQFGWYDSTIMVKEEVIIKENVEEVTKELALLVEQEAKTAIDSRGKFVIGLSGGSLVGFLSAGLPGINTDWSRWHVVFCDERVVPFDSDDSTFGVYRRQLTSRGGALPLAEDQFVTVDPTLDAPAAAAQYASRLEALLGGGPAPRCDLLLLGMGPDGHTCSLFPGHALLAVADRAVAAITDSPKPPPARVTLTLPALNAARVCAFAMAGAGKADMVRRVLRQREPLPAALVQPTEGRLVWILDQAAAAQL